MITDEALESWLADVAGQVPLPEGGLEAALAALTDPPRTRAGWPARLTSRRGLAAAAVVLFVAVAGGVAVVHHERGTRSSQTLDERFSSSTAAAPPAAAAAPPTASTDQLSSGAAAGSGGSAGSTTSGTSGSAAAPVSPGATAAPVPGLTPRVVRTATVDLQVPKDGAAAALAKVRALVGATGYVASSSTSTGDDAGGTITLRIPSADYDHVRDQLAGGSYGTVLTLQEQGKDVTAQYTDIAARLTALEATRATYLTLLSRATTIGDTLAVQQQINAVQVQIEQLQGQQKVLADQSDDATVTVTVSEVGVGAPSVHHSNGWTHAFSRAGHSVVRAVQGLIAASGVALIGVVAVGLVALVGRLAYRRVRRRMI